MIGVYDYTVILTFLSLLSASTGIITTLSGSGHPYIGSFFLLFCGLCDAFDGKIARRKVDRTDISRRFGIQIDSLSDLVAFGVLPACTAPRSSAYRPLCTAFRRHSVINSSARLSDTCCMPFLCSTFSPL